MAKFIISTRNNGDFQFNLKADNGQSVLSSEGYTTKAACTNGIESVKKNSQSKDNFEKNVAKNGKHYFNLKAGNGQIVGTSQMYEAENGMINGIASVIKNAHNADVIDEIA